MTQTTLHAVIHQYTKTLRLPTIGRLFPQLSRQATSDGWPYEDYLKQLLEHEVITRQDKAVIRRIKQAEFPDHKSLDQINWNHLKGIAKPKMLELARCEYIDKAGDVIIAGPIGTGKTHLAIALGLEAAKRGHRVAFTRAADLVRDLTEARDERILGRLHQRFTRVGLLVLDELGFVPFEREGGELLFNLLAERYERRSTLITTNLAFSEWVQVFQSEKLTAALLDRLSHHAHVLTTKGSSYRAGTRNHDS